jgi:UPF0755 protein
MARLTRSNILYVLAGLLVSAALLAGAVAAYAFALRPPSAQDTNLVKFEVAPGQKSNAVVSQLHDQQLIRSRPAFQLYLALHGLRGKLIAGSYQLRRSYSSAEIADIITSGKVTENRLTIPEGTNLLQIKKLVSEKGITTDQFDVALKADYGKDFLIGRPHNVSLEGYLFPDSYQVDSTTTAEALVAAMIDNFDKKVTLELRQRFTDLGLTLHQGITLASIVEEEVTGAEDRAKVSQVMLKRLRMGMRLETDPTVQYAADLVGQPFNLDLASPYNTYRVTGLPPGPISNPGLDAIRAAANPADTEFLYFVSGRDGKTHFSKTFAEHERNIAKYLR